MKLAAFVLAVALIGLACGSPTREVVMTGSDRPADPGFPTYESRCASCHGSRAQGGVGPALAGHTTEQVLRQVRAPVGEMPIFMPDDLSDHALEALVEYVLALPESDDSHPGHEHGTVGLTKQEIAQVQHVLALTAIENDDVVDALHWIEEASAALSGTHLMAMDEARRHLESGDLDEAASIVSAMITDDPSTRGLGPHELVLSLAMNAAEMGDADEVEHQLSHLDSGSAEVRQLHELAEAGDLEAVRAEIARILALTEEPHDDEPDADHEDEQDHHDEPEADHEDEQDHHDDEAPADHDDEAPADHDDEGQPPHEHDDETAVDQADEGQPADDHSDEAAPDHDDTGLAPHDH